jgi:hypothetical protein
MSFAGVVSVIASVARVTAGSVSVMGSLLMLPALMVLGRFAMMASRVGVVFRRLSMMFGSFLRHSGSPGYELVTKKLSSEANEESTSMEFGS